MGFPHLSLVQIHAALAYYWDHQAELDGDIGRRRATAGRQQQQSLDAPLRARLRARAGADALMTSSSRSMFAMAGVCTRWLPRPSHPSGMLAGS